MDGLLNMGKSGNAMPDQQAAQAEQQKLQAHIDNVVKAAHAFMYSNETKQHFMDELRIHMKEGDPVSAAANTAVGVIMLLVSQSKFQMNQKAVIPAGIMIAGEILDFIYGSMGKKASEKDAHATIEMFIKLLQDAISKIMAGGQAQPDAQPAAQGA